MSDKYIYIKSYGCQMNVYDSNRIKDLFSNKGYKITDDVSKADLLFSDKTSFSANQIIINFDLNDIFFPDEDQLVTVLIDQITIESVELSSGIVLQGSQLEIKYNSLRDIKNSKISIYVSGISAKSSGYD